jgi:hypothetical protein
MIRREQREVCSFEKYKIKNRISFDYDFQRNNFANSQKVFRFFSLFTALQKLRGTSNVDGELNAIRMEYEKIKDQPAVTSKDIIVDPFLRRILLITLVLMIGQQLSGIDAVNNSSLS